MAGRVSHHRAGSPVLAYCCSFHRLKGPAACPHHRVVPEDVVLASVSDCILLALSGPEGDAWESALRERLQAANREVPEEARRLQAEIATLDANVQRAQRNLLLMEDPANIKPAEAQIRQWQARLSVLRPRLADVSKTAERVARVEERVAEARGAMLSVGQAFSLGSSDSKRLADRKAVQDVVERITCVWEEDRPSKLKGVRVEFRADSLLGDALCWPAEEPAEEEVCPSADTGRRRTAPGRRPCPARCCRSGRRCRAASPPPA